ncbi:ABC transporter permease [Rhizobium sp. NZLR1]|uniref:ABC transporter permease n=1 Tax=Rhizobium sp. NZLR1 TaxID=2731096 RepID=UPI001A997180|nr:ABC transporter permease [Rhizobium sp. NZLR1]MBX5204074.1 ABC transporter permease [Rhizobium sp. NZLR1]QSZ25130.1 ABC transporter permease [Rhizobium sp. NZLR1]
MNVIVKVAARLGLLGLTLWLVSVIVFMCGQILPGDVGRVMLGPFADADAVAALNHRLGTDQPALLQYIRWLGHALRGDFGLSLSFQSDAGPLIVYSLGHSALLAAIIMALLLPLGIGGGVLCGLRPGSLVDRSILFFGIAIATVPDFVSGLLLMMVFGLWVGWLPLSGSAPEGSNLLQELQYLILPALPLVLNLSCYVARTTRAGFIEASAADYTRTAVLKGLTRRTVITRHILRNALVPTVAVIATQTGYLFGGLVVIETLFGIQGLGNLILSAAKARDFPLLEGGVLAMATIYVLAAALGDLLQTLLDPRQRVRTGR